MSKPNLQLKLGNFTTRYNLQNPSLLTCQKTMRKDRKTELQKALRKERSSSSTYLSCTSTNRCTLFEKRMLSRTTIFQIYTCSIKLPEILKQWSMLFLSSKARSEPIKLLKLKHDILEVLWQLWHYIVKNKPTILVNNNANF